LFERLLKVETVQLLQGTSIVELMSYLKRCSIAASSGADKLGVMCRIGSATCAVVHSRNRRATICKNVNFQRAMRWMKKLETKSCRWAEPPTI